MKSRWFNHTGKDIFFADYKKLVDELFETEISRVTEEVCKQPLSSVRLLVDVSSMIISPKELNLFKHSAQKTKPFVDKVAVLGVNGARKALLDIVVKFSGMQVTTFDDIERAKNWLIR